MINPNELRFGNVVLAPTLTFNGVTMMPTILSYFNEYDATLAQPIPLTHEILENCGFKWNNHKMEFSGFKVYPSGDEFHLYVNQLEKYYDSNITSLHQLQNLYFALTGTELGVSKLFQPKVKTA